MLALVALFLNKQTMKLRTLFIAAAIAISALLFYGQAKNPQFNYKKIQHMEMNEVKLIKEFLTAVQTGEMTKVGSMLHPQVQWLQPGKSRVSGPKQSAQEVFAMVNTMFELSGNTLKLADIKWISANGSSVAALVRWTATSPTGKHLDVENIDVYTVKEGKIVSVVIYSADVDAENSFWGAN
jgi:uncharacterized protein